MPYLTAPTRQPLRSLIRRSFTLAASILLLSNVNPTATAGENRQFNEGSQTLNLSLPNGYQGRFGFYPVKITATNRGAQNVVWQVSVQEYGMDQTTLNAQGHKEQIIVGPRQTVEREILVAIGKREIESYWNNLMIEVTRPSGEREHWSPSNSSSGSNDEHGMNSPALITEKAANKIHNPPRRDSSYHGTLEIADAAQDWRAYNNYSLIVLTPADWNELSESSRNALSDWNRLGGQLQFVDGTPSNTPATDTPGLSRRGMGAIHTSTSERNTELYNLPGALALRSNQSALNPSIQAFTLRDGPIKNWLKQIKSDVLVERFTIWPTVMVLITFFVMITPVNLFMLAPTRRRHRLFRTVPIISLGACLLLGVAVVMGDGFGGKGRRLTLIECRPGNENLQYITQWQASRCGALLGTSFQIKDKAYLAPLGEIGSAVSLRVDGDGLEAGGGWFTSRATQSHFLQATRPSRGRIEWVKHDDNNASIVSTFDFPLYDIYIKLDSNTWWHASKIQRGETTTLQRITSQKALGAIHNRTRGMPQESNIQALGSRSNHYIAFTNKPPAIETLNAIDWEDTGIITGMLANP